MPKEIHPVTFFDRDAELPTTKDLRPKAQVVVNPAEHAPRVKTPVSAGPGQKPVVTEPDFEGVSMLPDVPELREHAEPKPAGPAPD